MKGDLEIYLILNKEILNRINNEPVVLMCGISGSGKTVFSQMLENEGFVRISADENVWNKYGDAFSSLPFTQQKEIFMATDAEIMQQLSSLFKERKRIVVDSTMCKRFKRDKMRSLCGTFGIEPLIVFLRAPKHLLAERLSQRKGSGPNDQIVTLNQLDSFYANFEVPDPDERVMVIDQETFINP